MFSMLCNILHQFAYVGHATPGPRNAVQYRRGPLCVSFYLLFGLAHVQVQRSPFDGPTPPPPPDEEDVVPDEPEEIDEVAESVAPVEMASDSQESSDVDLGIDIGDMALSTGGGFAIDIPRFGRRSGGGGDGDE